MRRLLLIVVLSLFAASVSAQPITPPIPIKGHPQLAAYIDRSQLPTVAGHMNWSPGENPVRPFLPTSAMVLDIVAGTLGNNLLGHGHMSLINCPIYGEIGSVAYPTFTCRFQILLFNVQAEAFVEPSFQDGIRDIKWDATGTSTSPRLLGELDKELTYEGSLVIDPKIAKQFPTKHGFWSAAFNATFRFANGDTDDKQLLASFYVVTDTSVPANNSTPFVSVRNSPHDVRDREAWGTNIVETLRNTPQYLPLLPISAPYVFRVDTNGYGADGLPPAITEVRTDSDIHHHVGGRVLQEISKNGIHSVSVMLDPGVLGPGKHKMIIGRRQAGLKSTAAIVDQLVFDVTVAAGTPPPPAQVAVPTLVGKTQTAADSALKAASLVLGVVSTAPAPSPTVPAGTVLSQTPAAMSMVPIGSAVAIVVSQAPVIPPPPPPPSLAGTYTYVCDAAGNCKFTLVKQ